MQAHVLPSSTHAAAGRVSAAGGRRRQESNRALPSALRKRLTMAPASHALTVALAAIAQFAGVAGTLTPPRRLDAEPVTCCGRPPMRAAAAAALRTRSPARPPACSAADRLAAARPDCSPGRRPGFALYVQRGPRRKWRWDIGRRLRRVRRGHDCPRWLQHARRHSRRMLPLDLRCQRARGRERLRRLRPGHDQGGGRRRLGCKHGL